MNSILKPKFIRLHFSCTTGLSSDTEVVHNLNFYWAPHDSTWFSEFGALRFARLATRGKDVELDAVVSQYEPYLTAWCVCMLVAPLWCHVTWDAVPEQSRFLKLRQNPAFGMLGLSLCCSWFASDPCLSLTMMPRWPQASVCVERWPPQTLGRAAGQFKFETSQWLVTSGKATTCHIPTSTRIALDSSKCDLSRDIPV